MQSSTSFCRLMGCLVVQVKDCRDADALLILLLFILLLFTARLNAPSIINCTACSTGRENLYVSHWGSGTKKCPTKSVPLSHKKCPTKISQQKCPNGRVSLSHCTAMSYLLLLTYISTATYPPTYLLYTAQSIDVGMFWCL